MGQNYKTSYEDEILTITIPDKLPNLKYKPTYTQKIILKTIINSCKQYEGLFLDEFVVVFVKIFESTQKRWDADNRTIKPIQDGLVYAGVIRDDSIFNSCYMVRGTGTERDSYIEVRVAKADRIIGFMYEEFYENT